MLLIATRQFMALPDAGSELSVSNEQGMAALLELSIALMLSIGLGLCLLSLIKLSRRLQSAANDYQALEEREKKYRELIGITGTGYVILDGKGNVLECNDAYSQLIGRSGPDKV
ncbi:hypothetical protein A9Q90_04810, partial [Gammaproteobacteria bacterium 54_18_T64]